MNCTKCGTEIEKDYLYCMNCGEDIHIVPDFELELEHSMKESMQSIIQEVQNNTMESQEHAKLKEKRENPPKKKHYFVWSIFIVLCSTIIVIIGVNIFLSYSYEYQLNKAKTALMNQNYEKAINYYDRAIILSPNTISLKIDMADCYFALGKDRKSVV